MRQPIPLKAELFSPLKENRRSSLSPLAAELALPSAADVARLDDDVGGTPLKTQDRVKIDADMEAKSPASPRDSGLGMNAPDVSHSSTSTDSASTSEAENQVPSLSARRLNVRPSLAERTRKSMAFNANDNALPDSSPSPPSPTPALFNEHDDIDDHTNRLSSLQARTRHSISLAPPPTNLAPRSKKPSHTRARTSVFPVSQFETPQKVRRSNVGIQEEDEEGMRTVTPMETLMSPEAEYNSVFKSRPKIAVSPVVTPRGRESVGIDEDASPGAEA